MQRTELNIDKDKQEQKFIVKEKNLMSILKS